jgi:hypothetical protein
MKSIEANYRKAQAKNPWLGEISCLGEAVKGKYFSRDTISRFFVKVIPKSEYDKYTKNSFIDQLADLSNQPLRRTKWEQKVDEMIAKNK